jgi:hypothetical protein
VISRARPLLAILIAAFATASCQPPDRDIRVRWREGALVIDFPWDVWRMLGMQDRSYCIGEVLLYEAGKILWTLHWPGNPVSCSDVEMPLAIGRPREGFTSTGAPRLKPGVRYGIAVEGLGNGRVDFILGDPGEQPVNITRWQELMPAPCGTYFGHSC